MYTQLEIKHTEYGSEVCNVGVQPNKKNNLFYFKFVLININFTCRFSILQYKVTL